MKTVRLISVESKVVHSIYHFYNATMTSKGHLQVRIALTAIFGLRFLTLPKSTFVGKTKGLNINFSNPKQARCLRLCLLSSDRKNGFKSSKLNMQCFDSVVA